MIASIKVLASASVRLSFTPLTVKVTFLLPDVKNSMFKEYSIDIYLLL
jgi:hypothetical protein